MTDVKEKPVKARNGYKALVMLILALAVFTLFFVYGCIDASSEDDASSLFITSLVLFIIAWIVFPILMAGLKTVKPNEAYVFTLFGSYYGTLKDEGFWFVNPFVVANDCRKNEEKDDEKKKTLSLSIGVQTAMPHSTRKTVSLKVQTFVNGIQKVNDKLGNPIMIGAVVIWKITDPTKAVFMVDDYKQYLSNQADSVIRNISRLYPYDDMSEDESSKETEMTLRGSSQEIAENMKASLQERVESAGIEVLEVKINHIAYSEEIAQAMLQRQQAVAIIAARRKIVEGAVSMVEMALEELKSKDIVDLDAERKAQMVSNLLVVLCGNKDAQPVVNSGSIY